MIFLVSVPIIALTTLYELGSAHEWFKDKERCIFCDMVRQEEKQGKRIVDVQGDYYALCPYASRVPYEIWMLHRRHNHTFEQPRPGSNRRQLAALLARIFRRLEKVAPALGVKVTKGPSWGLCYRYGKAGVGFLVRANRVTAVALFPGTGQ